MKGMIMMIEIILITAVVIINSPFQPGDFSIGSTADIPYRLDRNSHGGGILVYLRDNMPSNLVKLGQKFENFESFFIELELSKENKWLLSYSCNPHKGNIKQHLSNIRKGLDELNSKYDNILTMVI